MPSGLRNLLTLENPRKTTCVTENTLPSSLLEPGAYSEERVDVMNFLRCYLLYNIAVLLQFDTLR